MRDTSSRLKVLSSGVFCLVLTFGIGRFAYTPLLPIMFEQTLLNEVLGGWLATINYIGYMLGAITATLVGDLVIKDRLYRFGLILAVVTTLMMGLGENVWLWGFSRFIAGFGSATGLLIGSGLMMNWLLRHHHRSEMGLHFGGVGLGIVVVALLLEWLGDVLNWSELWLMFSAIGALLAIPAWRWLPKPDTGGITISGAILQDKPPSKRFLRLMMVVYFCAGFGFVVSATFIVALVEQQPALQGKGGVAFLILGLAAMPACLIWDVLSRHFGILNSLLLAFFIHGVGIVLPALNDSLSFVLMSAVLYGFTFIGIVSIVLTMAGRFYPTKPAKLMGKLTISYGVPQILAPTIAGYIVSATGSYNGALFSATAFVGVGFITICAIKLWAYDDLNKLESPDFSI